METLRVEELEQVSGGGGNAVDMSGLMNWINQLLASCGCPQMGGGSMSPPGMGCHHGGSGHTGSGCHSGSGGSTGSGHGSCHPAC